MHEKTQMWPSNGGGGEAGLQMVDAHTCPSLRPPG